MSTLRGRYRVVVDGVKYDTTTNARDMAMMQTVEMARAVVDGETEIKPDGLDGFRMVYMALRREGKYGGTFDEFVDLLDEFEREDDEQLPAGADDLDPTPAAGSANEP